MKRHTVKVPATYEPRAFQNIVRDLEGRLERLEAPVKTYTITNGVESRSLDVGAATLAQVRAFVGTLIADLQDAGKLGK